VLAVCFLALVGVVLLAGVLMLFSWFTATLPSQLFACPEVDGCAAPPPGENQAVGVEDPVLDEPTMTP
jgi:hypothetical protein